MVRLATRAVAAWAFAMSIASLPACQAGGAFNQEASDNTRFMNVWFTYTRCVTSSNLESTQHDSFQLRSIGRINLEQFDSPLPHLSPTTRLAVDLKAMSASCTLHAGDLAATSGRWDTARDMFNAVLREHPEPIYAYYAEQARARLIKLETGLQAFPRHS